MLFLLAPAAVVGVLLWIGSDMAVQGAGRLSWAFLTSAPEDGGRAGGIAPILVSTLVIMGITLAVAIPLSLGTAVLFGEFLPTGSRTAAVVRGSLDVLAAVPSIVFGIFGNAFFSIALGLGYSLLSGGLTLACMILPITIRATEQSLRAVAAEQRLAAAALSFTRTRTVLRVVLPLASPGILAGLLLGLARAVAETAALVFTSGYVDRMPESLLDSGRAISVHIYDLSMNVSGGDASAYASALVLTIVVLTLNGVLLCVNSLWKRLSGLHLPAMA